MHKYDVSDNESSAEATTRHQASQTPATRPTQR